MKDFIGFKTLTKTFKNMDNDKGNLGLELLKEACFLKETLERLKDQIKKNEVIGEMKQGSYSISRTNPTIKTYNTTVTNYQKIIKQLNEMLPTEKELLNDGFDDF